MENSPETSFYESISNVYICRTITYDMAILHRKEEKIQVVLGRLPKQYTQEEFVEMFIKLYSKDWGKIKAAYIKQNQDKEPGTVVNMPKPDLYLKQVLDTYLNAKPNEAPAAEIKVAKDISEETPVKSKKAAPKKNMEEEPIEAGTAKKTKAAPKKKAGTEASVTEAKVKVVAKKKVTEEKATPAKAKKEKATED